MNFRVSKALIHRIRLELARQSILSMGRTAPNPSVACLVLGESKDGEPLIFSGGTEPPGQRHAEIVALDTLDAQKNELNLERGLRLFVSLEPCSKFGRTPPCANRINSYPEIRNVSVFSMDPNLGGGGIQLLKDAGKKVLIRESFPLANAFLRGFLNRLNGHGPRLHLKAAHTSDGVMGLPDRRLLISGLQARRFTMLLRSKLDGVLVGPGTVAMDNPGLDLRALPELTPPPPFTSPGKDLLTESMLLFQEELEEQINENDLSRQPRRLFILDRPFANQDKFFANQANIAKRTGKDPVYFLLEGYHLNWKNLGHDCTILPRLSDSGFAPALRNALGALGLNEVMVEGGPGLFQALHRKLSRGDRIYQLASEQGAPASNNAIRLPDYFQEAPLLCEYELDQDKLILREYD